MDLMGLAQEWFGLPARPEPIQTLAQELRANADAIDQQHVPALYDTYSAALPGNAGSAMIQAGVDNDALARDLAATAAGLREHADNLDVIAYVFTLVIAAILLWTAYLIVSFLLNPLPAAVEVGAARTAIGGLRKEAENLIEKLFRKSKGAFDGEVVERGGTKMNMGRYGDKKGDDGASAGGRNESRHRSDVYVECSKSPSKKHEFETDDDGTYCKHCYISF